MRNPRHLRCIYKVPKLPLRQIAKCVDRGDQDGVGDFDKGGESVLHPLQRGSKRAHNAFKCYLYIVCQCVGIRDTLCALSH